MPRNRFAVVSNPEFLREGAAIEDFKQPERVIGVEDDERARLVIAKIYEPLSLFRAPASSGRSRATPPRSKRASSTVYRTRAESVQVVSRAGSSAG
jgi:UDPglucose 6-dehydrogenase